MDNHIGAVTKIHYESSVQFYLKDQADRLRHGVPCPVSGSGCFVEVIDELSRGKKTTQYQYHDGYWDGVDREFRGFGMVEQYDSESFDEYDRSGFAWQWVSFSKVPVNQFFFADPHQDMVPKGWWVMTMSSRRSRTCRRVLDWRSIAARTRKAHKEYLVPFEQSAKRDALRTLRERVRMELFCPGRVGTRGEALYQTRIPV